MPKTVYRFRSYQLDPRQRELWRGGRLIALPLKSFDCLVYLVEHRDRAVGRDELIAAVWGKTDINDHTLAQTLSRVRQVLRDGDGEAIRTMPRFGYRWVVPTERVDVDVAVEAEIGLDPAGLVLATSNDIQLSALTPPTAAKKDDPLTPRRHGLLLAALAGTAVLVASSGYLAWVRLASPPVEIAASAIPTPAPAPAATGEDTYLVMPVLVEASASDVAWMRLGVMDYIGVALKEGGQRRVLPNDQILSLTAGSKQSGPLESIELSRLMTLTGATYVVQAHARKTGIGWRVMLDLFHGDMLRSYTGTAPAPLEAVHAALEPMMADLKLAGRLAPLSSHGETLQRIDAALLVGDLALAQQQLDANATIVAEDPEFRLRVGQLALLRGRLDEARSVFHALIDDEPSTLSREQRSQAWLGLAGAEIQRPDFDAADRAYTEAIALLRDGSNEQLLGNAYRGRGASYANRDRFEEAMADFGRARVALDRAGDRIGIARLEVNMAAADAYRGRLGQALEAQDRAIRVLTAFGVRDQLLVALHNKIYVQLGLFDLDGALATSQQALEQATQLDNERMKTRIAAARTRVLLTGGHLAEAGRLLDRFDRAGAATSDPEFVSMRLEWLAQQGDYARAADLALDSFDRIAAAESLASQPMLAWTCLSGVDAALRIGRIDLAEQLLDRLAKAPAAARDADREVLQQLARAELLQARGRAAESRALFTTLLASAEREGDSGLIVAVASMGLRHLLAARDFDAAAPIAGRLKAYAGKDYTAARALGAYYRASGQTALANEIDVRLHELAGERDPRLPL